MAYPGCHGIMAAGRVGYLSLSCALRCCCALNKSFTSCLLSVIVSEDAEPRHFGWLIGWLGLTALSAQIGHIVPQRKLKFDKKSLSLIGS